MPQARDFLNAVLPPSGFTSGFSSPDSVTMATGNFKKLNNILINNNIKKLQEKLSLVSHERLNIAMFTTILASRGFTKIWLCLISASKKWKVFQSFIFKVSIRGFFNQWRLIAALLHFSSSFKLSELVWRNHL